MSWNENGRKSRIYKIIELLQHNPQGLMPYNIAESTGILQEVTKERFLKYLEELKWSRAIIELPNGKVKLKYVEKTLDE